MVVVVMKISMEETEEEHQASLNWERLDLAARH